MDTPTEADCDELTTAGEAQSAAMQEAVQNLKQDIEWLIERVERSKRAKPLMKDVGCDPIEPSDLEEARDRARLSMNTKEVQGGDSTEEEQPVIEQDENVADAAAIVVEARDAEKIGHGGPIASKWDIR